MTKSESLDRLREPTSGDCKDLASVENSVCVTIIMRTHRSGRETRQGAIRLQNAIDKAAEKLKGRSRSSDSDILDSLSALTNDQEFWQHQGDGLAIFLTPERTEMFRLNHSVDDHVHVGDSFFLKPLLEQLSGSNPFLVLALTWDEAKLYRGGASERLELVETNDLPAKYSDLVLPRDPETQLQYSSHQAHGGNRGGSQTAMYHGHGQGEDKIESDRNHYLSRVGEIVSAELYNTELPLVLCATDEVAGHFESTTDLRIDARVTGSPAQWTIEQLQQRVQEIAEPQLQDDDSDITERFGRAAFQQRASEDLAEVIEAAMSGRVDTLLIARGAERFGKVDRPHVAEQDSQEGETELINHAVIETLRHGGEVIPCDPDAMPGDDAVVAAIFRY